MPMGAVSLRSMIPDRSGEWAARDEVRLIEELAREYGFRLPRIDEDFVAYQAELSRHIAEVNHDGLN